MKHQLSISKRKIFNLKILFFILVFAFCLSSKARAAVLYLELSQEQYRQDDTFIAEARIDTEGECINTVKTSLSFPPDILEAIDFSEGSSILILWVESPKIDQNSGQISFIGGIPGGFCGKLLGDPGQTNLLGKIIFHALKTNKEQTSVNLEFLESSQVLLNDGLGTPAKLTRRGATFTVLSGTPEISENEWQTELNNDNIPPEDFKIEINSDPAIFEGKYFITFSTLDKQTGLDYYEVQEVLPWWTLKSTKFEKATGPYLLKDQSLRSIIKVKAVDKAGNERIAEYRPLKEPFPYWIIILVLLILTGSGFGYWFYRKTKLK